VTPAPRGRGLILAAPSSGQGKTLATLALLRALRDAGTRVAAAKAGPDYIDPGFHAAACGSPSTNLDVWAMRATTLGALVDALERDAELVLCEGVMGLFDGIGASIDGSTAALAEATGWPVLLVVDARAMAGSVGALVAGFARHRAATKLAGVLLNRVGGAVHEATLRAALAAATPELPVVGALPRADALALPSRHLGLVQAQELARLEETIVAAAALAARHVDLTQLAALARPARIAAPADRAVPLPPPGQRIAVASDPAFAFAYPATLEGWRRAGAEIRAFSPLANEPPPADCDAVFLPGGYPELHAGTLATAARFRSGLAHAGARGAWIYGECGGYMALGSGLVDRAGVRHAMAGLLPVETSFAAPRLHLGYRAARLLTDAAPGRAGAAFRGHEFHYASVVEEGDGPALFALADAGGFERGKAGRAIGRVAGSFIHLVDQRQGASDV